MGAMELEDLAHGEMRPLIHFGSYEMGVYKKGDKKIPSVRWLDRGLKIIRAQHNYVRT